MELVVPPPLGDDDDRPRPRARRARLSRGRRHRPRALRLLRPRGRRGARQRDQHDPRLHRDERLRQAVRGLRRRLSGALRPARCGSASTATGASASTGSSARLPHSGRPNTPSQVIKEIASRADKYGDGVRDGRLLLVWGRNRPSRSARGERRLGDLDLVLAGRARELGEPDQVVLRRLGDGEVDRLVGARVRDLARPARPSPRACPAGRRRRRRSSASQPPSAVLTERLVPSTGSPASTIRPTPGLPAASRITAEAVYSSVGQTVPRSPSIASSRLLGVLGSQSPSGSKSWAPH